MSIFYAISNCILLTCPNQGFNEPCVSTARMCNRIVNQAARQKTCILLYIEQYNHCSMKDNNNSLWNRLQREKNMRLQLNAMFGISIGTSWCHRNVPAGGPFPHISNCYHGEFPLSAQRISNYHFITRRFTDLRISRHHRVSAVYFELTIIGNSPFSRFLRLSRIFQTVLSGYLPDLLLSASLPVYWFLGIGFTGELSPH